MNDQNIVPYQFGGELRSGNEAREYGRQGGINSGISRRAKRDTRIIAAEALSQIPTLDKKLVESLKRMGMKGKAKPDMRYICVAAIMSKAMRGDVRAMDWMVKMAGETDEAEIMAAKAAEVVRRSGITEEATPQMDIDTVRRAMDEMTDEQLEQYQKLCEMFAQEEPTAGGDSQHEQ